MFVHVFHQAASFIELLSIILLFLRYFNIRTDIMQFHEIISLILLFTFMIHV